MLRAVQQRRAETRVLIESNKAKFAVAARREFMLVPFKNRAKYMLREELEQSGSRHRRITAISAPSREKNPR